MLKPKSACKYNCVYICVGLVCVCGKHVTLTVGIFYIQLSWWGFIKARHVSKLRAIKKLLMKGQRETSRSERLAEEEEKKCHHSEVFVITVVTRAETLLSVNKHLQMWGKNVCVKHKSASALTLPPTHTKLANVVTCMCVHACPCTGLHGWKQASQAGNCCCTPVFSVGKPSVCLLGLCAKL